ncbi:hypothetical protein BAMY_16010 [Bacillus amyloliquefaciens]|nr:hypothetical protein BAMY_16010 [Bacillus amyloliquefaciens]
MSRASYCLWKKNVKKNHCKGHLEKQIGALCRKHGYRQGYWIITSLIKKGMRVNHKMLQGIMQKNQ